MKLNISLRYIEIMYPIIPSFGTTKQIKEVEITKSKILIIITPTCASRPLNMLSTIVSIQIKVARGASSFIQIDAVTSLYKNSEILFEKTKRKH